MKYIVKNINDIDKSELDHFFKDIYELKRNRIKKDNYPSIYAEYLLSELLREEKINYRLIEVEENEYGKPYIKNHDIYYSISHSGDYVLVGIHNTPIGVDIQQMKDKLPNPKVMSKDEVKYNYIDIFSLKESYIKCIGSTMNHMKDVTLNLDGKTITSNQPGYEFLKFKSIPGYVISICMKRK